MKSNKVMAKYIPLDAVVTKIKKLQAIWDGMDSDYCKGQRIAYSDILSFLNTLEVKEVDLDYIKNELDEVVRIYKPDGDFGWGTLYNVATHFFELGLKAQHSELTWEDISVLRKIMAEYRRQTSNEMLVLNDEDYCKEVLNRFKTQKG